MPHIRINNKYLLILIIIVQLLLIGCADNKSTNPSVSPQSSLEFQQASTISKSRAITRVSAFESTLYPLLKNHCGRCHGAVGRTIPQFANSDVNAALVDMDTFSLANYGLPFGSKIVLKLSDQFHNCWSVCSENSITLGKAIMDWREAYSLSGQVLYQTSCESCHGAEGNGSNTVPAIRISLPQAELVTLIETTMPPADPSLCTGACATEIAEYISQGFSLPFSTANLHNPLAALPQGTEQLNALCAELAQIKQDDIINDVFCAQPTPSVTSLGELQSLLKLNFDISSPNFPEFPAFFTLLTHSTSLVARGISSINPRAIMFSSSVINTVPETVAMGFARGEQFVELFTRNRATGELFFYLFVFEQACNVDNQCGNSDLLTRNIEINWTNYTIYSQTGLQNTVFDCLHCHQPDGPGTKSIPRMQEINEPWTHYISSFTEGGQVLLEDFTTAHRSSEFYANIPITMVSFSEPFILELMIAEMMEQPIFSAPPPSPPNAVAPPATPWGIASQPNQFDSLIIEQEVKASNSAQPIVNVPPGKSATWDKIYEAGVRGEFIPVPYHDVKVTDAQKLKSMGDLLSQYIGGTLPAADLPDIRQVFLDEAARDMGFQVKAGLDGAGIITEACTQCHNSKLDQTISRARFNVDLTKMSDLSGGYLTGIQRDEVILSAISRLRMDNTDIRKMPPELFKHLTSAEIGLAVAYLCGEISVPASLCAN